MGETEKLQKRVHPVSRAIVTGASGFIGNALVRFLLDRGVETLSVSRSPANLGLGNYALDIRRPGALDSFLDERTVVFHMAARADVGGSVDDPRRDFQDNVVGTFEVFESVRKAGAQIVYPSTGSVFDPANALPLQETAYVRPTSPYGAAKVAGEAYSAAYYRSYHVDIRVARLFSVYGEGMNRFVISDLVKKISQNQSRIEIRGDGEQIRDYLYIDDVVRGLVHIAEHGEAGQDYNLASGIPVRLMSLARKIADFMGYPEIAIVPTGEPSPGDVPRWYADTSKIQQIGFAPRVSLEVGLRRTIKHLCEIARSEDCSK